MRGGAERLAGESGLLRALVLAEHLRSRLAAGGVNQATLARGLGVTRARVTQLLALLRLPGEVLAWIRGDGGPRARTLRATAAATPPTTALATACRGCSDVRVAS